MKQRKFLMLGACAMALTAFTSCYQDAMDEPAGGSNVSLTVVGTVEGIPTTRATDTSWEVGDSIGITSSGIVTNGKFVTSNGDGVFSATDTGLFLKDSDTHTFYAYYPYSAKIKSNYLIFNVCDSANVAAQKRNDIMVASGTASASNKTLQLQFQHAMARIIINVKTSTEDGFDADDVFDENCCAMINSLYTTCLLNVTTSSVTGYGSISNLYLVAPTDDRENHVRQYVVYLPSQTGRKFSLIFNRDTDNQQIYSVSLTTGTWAAGKSYTYNITAKRDRIDLTSASTISDWTSNSKDLDATFSK
jgi:hypothetical protein